MLKLDLSLSSNAQIYALLSHTAGTEITAADVTVGAPEPFAGQNGINTQVVLTRVAGSTKIKEGGEASLTRPYTRISIENIAVLKGYDETFAGDVTLYDTGAKVLTALNAALGTVLVAADVSFPAPFPTPVDGVLTVPVTVNTYGINGTLTLVVTDNVDRTETMEEAFSAATLNGFDVPA